MYRTMYVRSLVNFCQDLHSGAENYLCDPSTDGRGAQQAEHMNGQFWVVSARLFSQVQFETS